MAGRIRYNQMPPGATRRHYLAAEDVEVLLGRLPGEVYERLRAVHFNDRAFGRRRLGYVSCGRREIAICALPVRVSLSACMVERSKRRRTRGSPRQFGAVRGSQWPERAVRRFMLYDVFLHELGHLQIVDATARHECRQFASQTKAQEFADGWRLRLWEQTFEHPDPIHNPPSDAELVAIGYQLQ